MQAVETTEKTVRSHPWEPALGIAPFRYRGMYENRFDMGGGQWKPGGSCNYCGTGILYCYKIESSDGKTFVVGSECVMRCNGPAEEIVKVVKKARAEHMRVKRGEGRRARQKAAAEARKTAWEAKLAANKVWLATNPLYLRLKAHVVPEGQPGHNYFLADMMASLEKWGGLTKAQEDAAVRALDLIDSLPALRAASYWLGEIGARIQIEATVEFSKCLRYATYYEAASYINKMRTADGAAITWFGNRELKPGEKVTGTAKIKKLDSFNGEKQTIITNPRWK